MKLCGISVTRYLLNVGYCEIVWYICNTGYLLNVGYCETVGVYL